VLIVLTTKVVQQGGFARAAGAGEQHDLPATKLDGRRQTHRQFVQRSVIRPINAKPARDGLGALGPRCSPEIHVDPLSLN
jgi:hypothetical protein